MAYVNTGTKRSLTVMIIKEVNGVLVTGYPKTYNGQQQFVWNGVTYPFLNSQAFQLLSNADYELRLSAFKSYVASLEPGINFNTDTVAGYEPVITDLNDCPPTPGVSTTTTTGASTTTTLPNVGQMNIIINWGGPTGELNGLEGEGRTCSIPFSIVNPYTNLVYIRDISLPYDTPCEINIRNISSKINNLFINDFRYWKLSEDTEWIDFTGEDFFTVMLPLEGGNPVLNIDILITNVAVV